MNKRIQAGQYIPEIASRGKFAHRPELCGKPGVFPKDETLKEFVGRKPAAAVSTHLLIEHKYMYTMEECAEMIDPYARMAGGPTWGTMRKARNHRREVQTTDAEEENGRPLDDENRRLCDLSDALAVVAIEQDTEVQITKYNIDALRWKLSSPNVDNAPRGGDGVGGCREGPMRPRGKIRNTDTAWEVIQRKREIHRKTRTRWNSARHIRRRMRRGRADVA